MAETKRWAGGGDPLPVSLSHERGELLPPPPIGLNLPLPAGLALCCPLLATLPGALPPGGGAVSSVRGQAGSPGPERDTWPENAPPGKQTRE